MQEIHNKFKIGFVFYFGPGTILSDRRASRTGKRNGNICGQEMNMMNMNLSAAATIPSLSTPGEKEFYVFTSEIEGVDEEKLKVAGDAFAVNTLVTNKGDKVTVHFYNVDPVKEERHSFTIGDPYKVNIDVAFAEW